MLVQGAPTPVTVSPVPPPLTAQTAGSITSQYFTQGQVVVDTSLGNAAAINRLLALGAIA
jgi:hypothetical protein